jgi:PAS domain S-box-containing protein
MEPFVSTIATRVDAIKTSVPNTEFANAVLRRIGTAVCHTNNHGVFLDVNDEYCIFYGYSREELIGKHFSMVVPEENRAFATKLHDDFVKGEEELPAFWTVQTKRGELRTIFVTPIRLQDENGGTSKMTLIEPQD